MRIFLIIIAVIIVIILILVLLVAGAGVLFSRAGRVANPTQAKANGEDLIKNSRVVIAVGAHPDDLEYYTGGTLGTLAEAGKKVIGVTVCDLGVIQATRRAEGTKAAKVLGYRPIFLGFPERDYKGSRGLTEEQRVRVRADILAIVKKYHADTVIAYDSADQAPIYHHVDHIRTGVEVQAAAREAGVKRVFLYSTGDPNTQVDVKGAQLKKGQAIAAHVSQQNRGWIKFFRTVFGWLPFARPGGSAPGLTNTESFRKL
jgi:LmbE family N-acetylglucosaminyl deacetylase